MSRARQGASEMLRRENEIGAHRPRVLLDAPGPALMRSAVPNSSKFLRGREKLTRGAALPCLEFVSSHAGSPRPRAGAGECWLWDQQCRAAAERRMLKRTGGHREEVEAPGSLSRDRLRSRQKQWFSTISGQTKQLGALALRWKFWNFSGQACR